MTRTHELPQLISTRQPFHIRWFYRHLLGIYIYHRFIPLYLGMIEYKYVLINTSYLLVVKFDMSFMDELILYFKESIDHIFISFGRIAQITSLF